MITNKISHLNDRLKKAQENNAKAGESNEDSLDAFMSSLNTSTLSKSDITKMKVELQNLRREEMKLVKLINLTKPANLPPLVSQVQAEDKDDLQQKSKLSVRKISQLERRRKLFEANVSNLFSYFFFMQNVLLFYLRNNLKNYVFQNEGDSKRDSSTLYSNNMDNEEEEEEEEGDEEEKNGDEVKEKKDEEDTNVRESECKKSIPYKDETNDSMTTDDKPCITKNQETRKQHNVADDKKRKKDSKLEKVKSIKKHYDQDVHAEDYSTWVPPQDQSGDGRTNLNDKYGY